MTPGKAKTYIVTVNGGSGCLFQPMTGANEYTYILTAKHLFEGTTRDEDGAEVHIAQLTTMLYQSLGLPSRMVFGQKSVFLLSSLEAKTISRHLKRTPQF